jgi:hypothetical protein
VNEPIEEISMKRLFEEDVRYIIPMYQRNYAWNEGDIASLLQDIIDSLPSEQRYYIGVLDVSKHSIDAKTVYEILDGQQRLTTLSLLFSYLKKQKEIQLPWYRHSILDFECREHSQKTLCAIFEHRQNELLPNEQNLSLLNAYDIICKILRPKLKENNLTISRFFEYLSTKVVLMRSNAPHDADRNHYFEIMNNRGEQLEQHEILKSRLLGVLQHFSDQERQRKSRDCFHQIWETCANMDKYIQFGFTTTQREQIFGRKGEFLPKNFKDLQDTLQRDTGNESVTMTLKEIIFETKSTEEKEKRPSSDDESSEVFKSIIDFPNFLLQVLKASSAKNIPLNDKRLLQTFQEHLIESKDPEKIEQFGYDLLKCKYLYDHYIIKGSLTSLNDWSLKKYILDEENKSLRDINTFGDEEGKQDLNRRILMLQASFHVSFQSNIYKHWLNAALHWLYQTKVFTAEKYLSYLESVAKAFVFDHFLEGIAHEEADYHKIIYAYNGKCRSKKEDFTNEKLNERLQFGNIENFIFNYLDYLLWLNFKAKKPVAAYRFTPRSSVEHYYPQNPLPGQPRIPDESLHSFGNLCLISHSKNSQLRNHLPLAKKAYYENHPPDSIKQYLMMEYPSWDIQSIKEHDEKMKEILLSSLEESK